MDRRSSRMGIIPSTRLYVGVKKLGHGVVDEDTAGFLASRDPVKGPRMAAKYGQESYQTLIECKRGHLARFQIEPKQFEESFEFIALPLIFFLYIPLLIEQRTKIMPINNRREINTNPHHKVKIF